MRRVQVKITLLEIYNETIRDLLRPVGSEPEKLAVKENKDGSMHVPGITEKTVNSRDEVRAVPPLACRCVLWRGV